MPFDAAFLKSLEALNLLARRVLVGDERADRLTPRKGASLEFADYRSYTPGDEIRYIDWNVYARHGSLFIKEFAAEENVHVTILLDVSASMSYGPKFRAARELAAALGYVGLCNYDSVSLYAFGDTLRPVLTALRGKGALFQLLPAIDGLQTGGGTDMRAAFKAALPRLRGRSLVLLITDFYDVEGYADAVRALLAQRFGVHVVHLVARAEAEPELRGRCGLVDVETGRTRDVLLRPETVEAYRTRFGRYCEEVRVFCRSHEVAHARVLAEDPIERRVLDVLRAGGILEHR